MPSGDFFSTYFQMLLLFHVGCPLLCLIFPFRHCRCVCVVSVCCSLVFGYLFDYFSLLFFLYYRLYRFLVPQYIFRALVSFRVCLSTFSLHVWTMEFFNWFGRFLHFKQHRQQQSSDEFSSSAFPDLPINSDSNSISKSFVKLCQKFNFHPHTYLPFKFRFPHLLSLSPSLSLPLSLSLSFSLLLSREFAPTLSSSSTIFFLYFQNRFIHLELVFSTSCKHTHPKNSHTPFFLLVIHFHLSVAVCFSLSFSLFRFPFDGNALFLLLFRPQLTFVLSLLV